jgi:hypothetical protein
MERSEINPEQLFEELFDKPEESEESENVRLYTLGRPTFDDVYDADFMRRVYRVGYNTASVMITTRRHLDNLTLTTYPEAEPCGDHAGKEPWILFIVQHSRNRARGPAYKVAGIVTARSSQVAGQSSAPNLRPTYPISSYTGLRYATSRVEYARGSPGSPGAATTPLRVRYSRPRPCDDSFDYHAIHAIPPTMLRLYDSWTDVHKAAMET